MRNTNGDGDQLKMMQKWQRRKFVRSKILPIKTTSFIYLVCYTTSFP